jgi:flagellar protein FlgJ
MTVSAGEVSSQFALDANALGALKEQAKNDPKKALSTAASQFEALFMNMLLKSMREALPQDGALNSDTAKSYTSMFDQQMAQQLSKKGIGIAAMLTKQLSATLAHDKSAPDASPSPASPGKLAVTPAVTSAVPRAQKPATAASGSVADTIQGFVDKLRPYAEAVAQKLGVPAHYLIAQAGLETGWGKSLPRGADGAPSMNLFGIKATAAWKGGVTQTATTEYVGGQATKTVEPFRAYGSYSDSFQDFAKLLQNSRRYASALANTHDAGKYAASLQQAGYATDPRYAEKLTRAIQTVARYAPGSGSPPPTQVAVANADKRRDLA